MSNRIDLSDNHSVQSGPCMFCGAHVERTGFDLVDTAANRLVCFPCAEVRAPLIALVAASIRKGGA